MAAAANLEAEDAKARVGQAKAAAAERERAFAKLQDHCRRRLAQECPRAPGVGRRLETYPSTSKSPNHNGDTRRHHPHLHRQETTQPVVLRQKALSTLATLHQDVHEPPRTPSTTPRSATPGVVVYPAPLPEELEPAGESPEAALAKAVEAGLRREQQVPGRGTHRRTRPCLRQLSCVSLPRDSGVPAAYLGGLG